MKHKQRNEEPTLTYLAHFLSSRHFEFLLFFQMVFISSTLQQDLKTINDKLKQFCEKNPHNYIKDPGKLAAESATCHNLQIATAMRI